MRHTVTSESLKPRSPSPGEDIEDAQDHSSFPGISIFFRTCPSGSDDPCLTECVNNGSERKCMSLILTYILLDKPPCILSSIVPVPQLVQLTGAWPAKLVSCRFNLQHEITVMR